MKYLLTIKEKGPESVQPLLREAGMEASFDLTKLVRKWRRNGDVLILLACMRKVLPALVGQLSDKEKELLEEIEAGYDAAVVRVELPEKGEKV